MVAAVIGNDVIGNDAVGASAPVGGGQLCPDSGGTITRDFPAPETASPGAGGSMEDGMILEGQFTIPAPQERVWAAVWDVPTLASWVPGCTSAEQVDDTTYRARMEQQVGFLKASFDLLLRVTETEAPRLVRLTGEGEDRKIRSNIQATIEVELAPDPEGTRLRYRMDMSVLGRLGALGFPLIQRKAKEIEAEFARRSRAGLAGG